MVLLSATSGHPFFNLKKQTKISLTDAAHYMLCTKQQQPTHRHRDNLVNIVEHLAAKGAFFRISGGQTRVKRKLVM